jgi:hypothetical protein
MQGTYMVKFYLNVDMTEDAFINELDSSIDFTTVCHYELQEG